MMQEWIVRPGVNPLHHRDVARGKSRLAVFEIINPGADKGIVESQGFHFVDGLIEISMPLQTRSAVLWLPPVAVRTFQNRTYVVIQTTDGQQVSDVEIGLRTPDRVEIKSGVNEGDVVVGP